MQHKSYAQLITDQYSLARSKHLVSVGMQRAAIENDLQSVHLTLRRSWRLEKAAQDIRRRMYHRQRAQNIPALKASREITGDRYISLRHDDRVQTVWFSPLTATDFLLGRIGPDSSLGSQLKTSGLMDIITIPTEAGDKTFQIVSISECPVPTPAGSRSIGATDCSNDRHTTSA
jgi:hypothetical protein